MEKIRWLCRSITCLFKGHDDVFTVYSPMTGERDCGVICHRCGRPRLSRWGSFIGGS